MKNIIFTYAVTGLVTIFSFSGLLAQISDLKGNISGLMKANAVGNLTKAYMHFLQVNQARANLENELSQARETYWELYVAKKNLDSARAHYLQALMAKDMWLFSMDFMDNLNEKLGGGRKADDSKIAGWGSMISMLQGGKIDGGVEPQAEDAYQHWKGSVIYYWNKNASGLTDSKTLLTAFEKCSDKYFTYVQKRDAAEYLFHNRHSPLQSPDADTWFKGYLIAFTNINLNEADRYVQDLYKLFPEDLVKSELKKFTGTVNIDRMKLGNNRTAHFGLEWNLAKTSAKAYALYMIKRRYLCGWEAARQVLERRLKRYSEPVVSKAVNAVWAAKDDQSQPCVGDPAIMENRFRADLQKGQPTIYYKTSDCFAEALGPQTLWLDLVDMLPDKSVLLRYKQQVLDEFAGALSVEGLEGRSIVDRYNMLFNIVNEKLLLGAWYLFDSIGNNLDRTDNGGLPRSRRPEINGKSNQFDMRIFELFEGMAMAAKEYTSVGIYAWSRTLSDATPIGRLESAALEYAVFQKKYSAEALKKAVIKGTSDPKLPFFRSYDYSKITIGELQLLTSTGKDKKFSAADKMATTQKYKQLVAAYDSIAYSRPVIFDCSEFRVDLHLPLQDSSLGILLYLKKDASYEIGGNPEFTLLLNELLLPVLKKYCPNTKYLRCELYYEGSYLTDDLKELDKESWAKYRKDPYFKEQKKLMLFYLKPNAEGIYELARFPWPTSSLSNSQTNYSYNSLAGYRKAYFKNQSYYNTMEIYSWQLPYKYVNPGENCSDSMVIMRSVINFNEFKDSVQFLKQFKHVNNYLLYKPDKGQNNFCNAATIKRIVHVFYVGDREVWRSWSSSVDNWATLYVVYQKMENGQVINQGRMVTLP